MQKPRIPAVLAGKLIFGNTEQITALKQYEGDCFSYFGDGKERTYNVHICVEHDEVVQVQAGSEFEAEEKAKDEFDSFDLDYDISFSADPVENDC